MRYTNFVCLECRHVASASQSTRCPRGHGDMINMGPRFKAPRKRDDRAWRAVEQVVRDQRGFGGGGGGYGRHRGPHMFLRMHRTRSELRQMDVPKRVVPGARKLGQYPYIYEDEPDVPKWYGRRRFRRQ